jgi:hypothetical protein
MEDIDLSKTTMFTCNGVIGESKLRTGERWNSKQTIDITFFYKINNYVVDREEYIKILTDRSVKICAKNQEDNITNTALGMSSLTCADKISESKMLGKVRHAAKKGMTTYEKSRQFGLEDYKACGIRYGVEVSNNDEKKNEFLLTNSIIYHPVEGSYTTGIPPTFAKGSKGSASEEDDADELDDEKEAGEDLSDDDAAVGSDDEIPCDDEIPDEI